MDDVLVLSREGAGGVRPIAEILDHLGKRPILVSDVAADPNRDACSEHLVVDWRASGIDGVITVIGNARVQPAGVVTMVESLIPAQTGLARHYRLAGGGDSREALSNKAWVRATMRALGLSEVAFVNGPTGAIDLDTVTRYPVVVKPAVDSGASRLVSRADSPDELHARLHELTRTKGAEFDVIIEDYLHGTEFSVDGLAVDGAFIGLFYAEKPDHDEARHHDAGLLIAPPQSAHVRASGAAAVQMVDALCNKLSLSGLWLHVEARALGDGRTELVEINVRPGGGMYRAATIRSCGIDPYWEAMHMALDDSYITEYTGVAQTNQLLGMLPFEVTQVGRVAAITPIDELLSIEGVLQGYSVDGLTVTTLDRENFCGEVLLSAPDIRTLRTLAERVKSAFRVHIVPV